MRERRAIGHTTTSCGPCGHLGLVLTESLQVRRGLARLRPGFDADRRVYELCEDCGSKHAVELVA
jgi:transposase